MATFTLPENLDGLTPEELAQLRQDALDRQKTLNGLGDDELTEAQIDELEKLPAALGAIDAADAARTAAADEKAQRIAAAREANKAPEKTPENEAEDKEPGDDEDPEEGEPEGEPEPEAKVDVEIPNDASELIENETKEPVMASAAQRAAQKTTPPAAEPEIGQAKFAYRAGANVNGEFAMGEDLGDFGGVAKVFGARLNTIPRFSGGVQREAVAAIEKPVDERFHVSPRQGDEVNSEILYRAANEQRIVKNAFGVAEVEPTKALVAAGGFMHPPVVDYTIPVLEQSGQGNLVLPRVTLERGSMRYTKGIDFTDIYSDTGFALTEEQVEADTPKHLTEITAPEFEDVKLDMIGYGLRAGFLTAKTWPELIQRYLAGVKVAHEAKKNATIIARVAAKLGTAKTTGDHGSVVGDSLYSLENAATRLRQKFRLALNATIEGMAPYWMVNVLRADLAYQEGVDTKSITNAQVESWLSARNISLQWVYDWQDLSGDFTAAALADYPTTATVGLWPQGTFVQGELDIVSLDVVYDTASLVVNTYTAAFFEEGIAVFNPQASGVALSIPLVSHFGRVGAHDITNKAAA